MAQEPESIMHRYLRNVPLGLAAIACLALATTHPAVAKKKNHTCPSSLAFIAPKLKTKPQDGRYYAEIRASIRRPIAAVVKDDGGEFQTRDRITGERANAMAKLVNGIDGPERRYYQDVVLRATETLKLMSCRVVHRTT